MDYIIGAGELTMLRHLLVALVFGALIGLERSIHGRPAGFRTHTLVCVASAALMLVSVYQEHWSGTLVVETVRTDPTRMAQGIMTGVGFIGAGVIFKDGLSVRGLTTAASVWITASIGILVGIGFYFPAAVSTLAALGVLSAFRLVEGWLPRAVHAHHHLKFRNDETVLREEEIRALLKEHQFTVANMSYGVVDEGRSFEYRMVIRTRRADNLRRLAWSLRSLPSLLEFRLAAAGD